MIGSLLALSLAAAAANEPSCNWRNAVPADVRQMAREPQRWLDRCVRLEGYVSYNRFYSDVAGYYRYVARDYADHRNEGWLGLYPRRRYGFRGGMRRGHVVGVLHDCQIDQDRSGAIMMTGFCHYRYGLVVNPAFFRSAGAAEFERQMGDAARLRFGDLQTEAEVGRPPSEVAALTARFVEAVLARDGETLHSLVAFLDDDEGPEAVLASSQRTFLLGEGGSPLADLRPSSQRIFFRERGPVDSEADPFRGWHLCFCRTVGCSGTWPISRVDATASPEHPYWCAMIYASGDERLPDRLGIRTGPAYPLEPARTAFRRPSESSRR